MDVKSKETNGNEVRNSTDSSGNKCETFYKTRNASQVSSVHATMLFKYAGSSKLVNDYKDRHSIPDTSSNTLEKKKITDVNVMPSPKLTNKGVVAGHSGIRPFSLAQGRRKWHVCDLCHKKFKKKNALTLHQFTHSGEKPFVCDTCGKGFAQKVNLSRHALTHSGEKPFVCNTCGKGFSRKEHLGQHALTHSGEKPFSCDNCEKAFSRKERLKRHVLTHSGEKPFVCNTCGKAFCRKDGLDQHRRSHTGEKPYVCDNCGRSFSNRSSYHRHICSS